MIDLLCWVGCSHFLAVVIYFFNMYSFVHSFTYPVIHDIYSSIYSFIYLLNYLIIISFVINSHIIQLFLCLVNCFIRLPVSLYFSSLKTDDSVFPVYSPCHGLCLSSVSLLVCPPKCVLTCQQAAICCRLLFVFHLPQMLVIRFLVSGSLHACCTVYSVY